jgi:hypothetical protein
MSIKNLIERGILEKCDYSQTEIDDLLRIVERDLKDSATVGVSYDWQFGISYNAALKLDVKELRELIIEFKDVVLKWLSKKK